jgi:hypothetical protein
MVYRIRFVRHRRFLLLGIGLWLLGELLSGPLPYPQLWLSVAGGIAVLVVIAVFFPNVRYHAISVLVAIVPVRMFAPEIAALARDALPEAGVLAAAGAIALAILAGSRVVALLAWPLDRVTLRRPWFSEVQRFVPRKRAEVWRALCLTEQCEHWDPRIIRIAQDMRFPTRFVLFLGDSKDRPDRITLREIDREEGMFQELEAEAVEGYLHGLAPIVSVLLEEVRGGTRVTMVLEFQNASLLRLARFFIDAPLTSYVLRFRAEMSARPALLAPTGHKRLAA